MRYWVLTLVTLIFVALAAGCSGGNNSPTFPGSNGQSDLNLTGTSNRTSDSSTHPVLWGYWDIAIDTANGTVEIVPVRGVQWTVDVVRFLQPPGGPVNSLGIQIVDMSEYLTLGRIQVDVSLTHPFPGLFQFTGADVRGIFLTTGNETLYQDTDVTYSDRGGLDAYLANPDGYIRWMNPMEFPTDGTIFTYLPGKLGTPGDFDATINAYKYFANDLEDEDDLYTFFSIPDNLENRGQFTPSVTNTRLYDLYFPMDGDKPILTYQYAVIASWADPIDLDPGDLPGSFPVEANCQEAFLVNAVDNGTLYYTTEQAGGDILLDLEIFDWAPFVTGEGSVPGEINRIIVESPQEILPTNFVEFDASTILSNALPGTTAASSIVPIEITGCLPKDINNQEVLITIEHGGGVGYDNYGAATNYPDAPLASYFFFTLNVSSVIPQTDGPVVTAIDPDHGLPDTYMYDVVITGENFDGVTEVKLVGDSEETIVQNMAIVDEFTITCELDLDGLSLGLYDVVAVDPVNGDGTLVDGFELMDCPGGIPNELTLYSTNTAYDPLFVAGVFTSGQYEGQTITQRGSYSWNRIDVTDPPTDNTNVVYYADKYSISSMYSDWSWSLDCDPINEVFAYTTFDDDDDSGSWPNTQFDFVKIIKQEDGSYVGACDTDCGYAVGQVDIDERGNVWAVCSNAYYPNMSWTIQRWDYDESAPAPYYTKVGDYDVSSIIGGDRVVSDIVVLQRYRRMYVSCSNGWSPWGVRIYAWDISGDEPVFLNSALATQTGFYGTDSYQEVHQRFVDMEVDRTDDVLAACRIMVMFMGQPSTNRTLELRKYDLDLNLINESSMEFYWAWSASGYDYVGWFSNFVLDDEHGGRVVAPYDRFNNPSSTGIVGVTNIDPDW